MYTMHTRTDLRFILVSIWTHRRTAGILRSARDSAKQMRIVNTKNVNQKYANPKYLHFQHNKQWRHTSAASCKTTRTKLIMKYEKNEKTIIEQMEKSRMESMLARQILSRNCILYLIALSKSNHVADTDTFRLCCQCFFFRFLFIPFHSPICLYERWSTECDAYCHLNKHHQGGLCIYCVADAKRKSSSHSIHTICAFIASNWLAI